jgi:hypothetical protein
MTSIHLQSIGEVESIRADEVEPGMSVMFNFGIVYTVVSVKQVSKWYLSITLRDKMGNTHDMRKRTISQIVAWHPEV